MRRAWQVSSIAIWLLAAGGCERFPFAPEWQYPSSSNKDTLVLHVTPGITLNLTGLKDTYALNDTISGNIELKNESDPNPLIMWTNSMPVQRVHIRLVGSDDWVYYYPSFVLYAEFRDTLRLGDSLIFRFQWSGETLYPHETDWSTLGPFSGTYELDAWLGGNSLLDRPLTKFITISETGYPLSGDLRIDYASTDSIKADFTVRNRNSRSITLDVSDSTPVSMTFLSGTDTVVVLRYPLSPGMGRLPGFSDNTLLSFKAAKGDRQFNGLKGVCWVWAALHLRSGDVSGRGLLFFPPGPQQG